MVGTKNLKRSRRNDYEDEDVSSDQDVKSTKKSNKKSKTSKAGGAADSGKDDDGNSFWALGGTRRVTISGFKGKTYINLREYYTDASGDLKPTKKGIMLTPEQYNKLVEAIPAINAELREKGHEITDIPSSASAAAAAVAPESPKTAKEKKTTKKANIEATSDEDEDEDEDEAD
ncbi:PC4-domain-containing protein [Xylariaceae sp. FL0662B]|nr:PC4-domain-containing protein [Xylariaceae sp. FL0662B]